MGLIIAIMLGISTLLGALALLGLLWGIKNRQFEDYTKFLDGTKYDSEEALNEAYDMEKRKNRLLEKRRQNKVADNEYRPPD